MSIYTSITLPIPWLLYVLTTFPPMIMSSDLPQLPSPTDATLDLVVTANYSASITSGSHIHISNHHVPIFPAYSHQGLTYRSHFTPLGPTSCLSYGLFSLSLACMFNSPLIQFKYHDLLYSNSIAHAQNPYFLPLP